MRLLLIEDEPQMVEALKAAFARHDILVDAVSTIADAELTLLAESPGPGQGWFQDRWRNLRQRLVDIVDRPQPHARCVPVQGSERAISDTIPDYETPPAQKPLAHFRRPSWR